QAHHVPVRDDLVVGPRNEEVARHPLGAVARARHRGAENHPVAMGGAAGECPTTAEAVATLDPLDLADGHVRRAHPRIGILAPHVLRGAIVEQRQLPVVNREHGVDPCAAHASGGQRSRDVEVHLGRQFESAETRRLQHLEEARLRELVDGRRGHLPGLDGRAFTRAQYRHELHRPREQGARPLRLTRRLHDARSGCGATRRRSALRPSMTMIRLTTRTSVLIQIAGEKSWPRNIIAASAGPAPKPTVWMQPIATTTRPRESAFAQTPDNSGCARFHAKLKMIPDAMSAAGATCPTSSQKLTRDAPPLT